MLLLVLVVTDCYLLMLGNANAMGMACQWQIAMASQWLMVSLSVSDAVPGPEQCRWHCILQQTPNLTPFEDETETGFAGFVFLDPYNQSFLLNLESSYMTNTG